MTEDVFFAILMFVIKDKYGDLCQLSYTQPEVEFCRWQTAVLSFGLNSYHLEILPPI